MAIKLTPLGIISKWVVIPIVLGVAGFYLIGPRIGEVASTVKKVPGLGSAVEHLRRAALQAKGQDVNDPTDENIAPKPNDRSKAFKELRDRARGSHGSNQDSTDNQ